MEGMPLLTNRSRPLQLLYGLIFIAAIGLLVVAWHSIQAFEEKVYSLREGYLNEITHALAGPVATLADRGLDQPDALAEVFRPFSELSHTELYDVEVEHRLVLHLLITDPRGQVIYDSAGKLLGADVSSRPEVATALEGFVLRRDEDEGQGIYRMSVGLPIRRGETILGALVASKSNVLLKPLVIAVEQGMLLVFAATGLLAVLLLLTAYLLLYRPIEIWLGRLDQARGGSPILRPNLRRARFGRLGILLDRVHEAISEKRHMEQMVACLAHEMKNPITAVRIHTELLGRSHQGSERRQLIAEIKSCCDRMTQVTERLLVIAAIERQDALTELTPIRIGDVLEAVVNGHRHSADQQHIDLRLEGNVDCQVRCEPVLMELAVGNLLQNAIDHSPRGRRVVISAVAQGKTVAIHVRDHGNGIPDAVVHQVFDKYFTLPKESTGRKGTGIGLNVVQHVADLHYGSVSLTNHSEGGVLAVLSIPV